MSPGFKTLKCWNNQGADKIAFVPDGNNLFDVKIFSHQRLNVQWGNVFTTRGNDQIFDSVSYFQIALFVELADIASFEPAIYDCLCTCSGVVEITLHNLGTSNLNFTILSNPDLTIRHQFANRAKFEIIRSIIGDHR